jgi:hypothetical protein
VIALIVGIVVLAVAAAGWARFNAGRSERHSVESYEHVLDVLGDVSRRGEATAPVRPPGSDEVARPHVRPSGGADQVRPIARADLEPRPQLRLYPPARIDSSTTRAEEVAPATAQPSEVDEAPLGASAAAATPAEVVITFDDLPDPIEFGSMSGRATRAMRRGRDHLSRRIATGAAAAVVLGALGVGGWQLAANRGPAHPLSSTPPPHQTSHHHTTTSTVPPTSVVPTTLQPVSTTTRLVTYEVPSASFTVSFKASAPCWLGVRSATSSPYLWMDTLTSGAAATYPTQGTEQDSIVVLIGAPGVVSISVNGIPVSLPSGVDQPYYISLTPQAGPST